MGIGLIDYAHCSDVFDAEAFLDELDNHLDLAALASVARVWDRDGWAGGTIVVVDRVVDGIGHGGWMTTTRTSASGPELVPFFPPDT